MTSWQSFRPQCAKTSERRNRWLTFTICFTEKKTEMSSRSDSTRCLSSAISVIISANLMSVFTAVFPSLAQLAITAHDMCLRRYSAVQAGKLMNQTSEFGLHTAPAMPPPPREIYMELKIPDVKRLFSRVTVSWDQLNEQMKQALMTSTNSRQAFFSLSVSVGTLEIFLHLPTPSQSHLNSN